MVIDLDFICVKPLDELTHRYDYFASFEPYLAWYSEPIINGGMQAAAKGLPLIDTMLHNFIRLYHDKIFEEEKKLNVLPSWLPHQKTFFN